MKTTSRFMTFALGLLTALAVMLGGCVAQRQEIVRHFGPVTVTIAAGKAELHHSGFEKMHPIEASGKIADVAIGAVPYADSTCVVLILEDGALEWLQVNPEDLQYLDTVKPLGPLPWIGDIVEVSYEESHERPEHMTFYAVDRDGLHYDLERLFGLLDATELLWSYLWIPETDDYVYHFSSVLTLEADGSAEMTTGWDDPDSGWETFSGTYRTFFDEEGSQGYQPGTLLLDLESHEDDRQISGVYSFSGFFGETMHLSLLNGDALFELDGEPVLHYEYFGIVPYTRPTSVPGMTDEELVDYVYDSVESVRHLVEEESMTLLVSGSVTELFGDDCRDVWLGHEVGGEFVVRRYYTVRPRGQIYWYDPSGDAYLRVD